MKLIGKGLYLILLFSLLLVISSFSVSANPCDGARIGDLDGDSWCYISMDYLGNTYPELRWENAVGNICIFNYVFLYPAYYRCRNDELNSDHYNTCDANDNTLINFAYLKGCSGCNDYSERESVKCPNGYLCEQRPENLENGGAYCKLSQLKLKSTNSFCGLTKINSFYRSYPLNLYNPSASDAKLRVINNITDVACPDGESCIVLSGYGAIESTHLAASSTQYLLAVYIKKNLGSPSLTVDIVEYNNNGDIVNTTLASITPNPSGANEMLSKSFTTTTTTSRLNITFRQTVNAITNELYLSPYFGESTSCTEAGNCRDGVDNDFDTLIDFADPDCQVPAYCPNFTSAALMDGAANDGSDGCCGDDDVRGCVAGTALIHPPACNYYFTQTECQTNLWCKWNPSNFCELKLLPEYCSQFSQLDCPSGACQFQEGDYGYVTSDNQYLCYNNKSNFNAGTTDKWMWIYAPANPFIITPLNFSGKTVDYISNYDSWYYCDANAPEGLTGLPIDEYKSFPAPELGGLMMKCSDAATYLSASLSNPPYIDCADVQLGYDYCCTDFEPPFNILENPEIFITQCQCTNIQENQPDLFCNIEENKELPFCKDYSFTNDNILTEFCKQNPRNCVKLDEYDTSRACNNQPFQSGRNCSATQVCSKGVMIPVLNNEPCCIGDDAICIEKSQINTQEICQESGGKPYFPSNTTFCLPENQSIDMSPEEGACCFAAILHTDSFPWSSLENINNNTFSCFAYQGNSLFGQCCYGFCNSMGLFNSPYVDATKNRAFSIKLPFNIQNSYDSYNSSAGILQDYSRTTTTPDFDFYQIAYFNGKKNISMAFYDYLEFDIIYNQLINVKYIYINNLDYGSVTQYVNNGERTGIAHHVKIPLRQESKMEQLSKIKMLTNSSGVSVLYDNLYFSINTDTPESSLNYYCTGGFASWINDLDPPINDPDDVFFKDVNAYMYGYGRYAVACDAYLPYGWTGHYCCGDDTNQTNYGEYYEDKINPTWPTTGGCFRGSTVVDRESVWKIKGYIEDHTYFFDPDEELKSYNYSDLIYAVDSFVGCQIPSNKYPDLRVSYDGLTQTATTLINDVINDSCTVVGSYYCMNGIWRQYIPGLSQTYSRYNNIYLPAIPSSLELKSVPPATELVKNSDFGGPCPPDVCDGNTIINTEQ